MLREVSRIELALWFADLRAGTLADERADGRMAVIASAAMNGPHFLKQNKKEWTPEDFLPKRDDAEARRTAELSKQIRSIFKGMGK